jgi:hypothetical protein
LPREAPFDDLASPRFLFESWRALDSCVACWRRPHKRGFTAFGRDLRRPVYAYACTAETETPWGRVMFEDGTHVWRNNKASCT